MIVTWYPALRRQIAVWSPMTPPLALRQTSAISLLDHGRYPSTTTWDMILPRLTISSFMYQSCRRELEHVRESKSRRVQLSGDDLSQSICMSRIRIGYSKSLQFISSYQLPKVNAVWVSRLKTTMITPDTSTPNSLQTSAIDENPRLPVQRHCYIQSECSPRDASIAF